MTSRSFTVRVDLAAKPRLSVVGATAADRALARLLADVPLDGPACEVFRAAVTAAAGNAVVFKFGKPTPRKAEKKSRRVERRISTSRIRSAVMARAGGLCECCGKRGVLVLDHWLGGSGRRRHQEGVATTWALCIDPCNRWRTENSPSAAWWNVAFAAHCHRHGLTFIPHIEKAPPAFPKKARTA